MIIEVELPDSAYNISVHYEYKGKVGETIYAAKAIEGVRFHCVPAKMLDVMWRKDYAEKQEQEKASQ